MKWLLPGLMLAGMLVAGCRDGAREERVRFEPVEAETVDGSQGRLAPAPGEVLVVNFWGAWCPPCRRELPALERLAASLPAGIRVEAVELGTDPGLVAEFLAAHRISFARWVLPDRRAVRASHGVATVPQTLVVGPDGTIVARIHGERAWRPEDWRPRLETLLTEGMWNMEGAS